MVEKIFIPVSSLKTPVLFLVFNRMEATRQVFSAIRKAKPPRLYVASDGPRASKDGEDEKVHAIRDYIIKNIDWLCEIKTLLRQENLGCKLAVSSAITWFFENEEMGIILEDDCLPSQSFFWFCEDLLYHYKNNPDVMSISGTHFGRKEHYGSDYYYSNYSLMWGWATWRDAWLKFSLDVSDYKEIISKKKFNLPVKLRWKNNFKLIHTINTWDYPWILSIWRNGGVACRSKVNLVKNIGFGSDGTRTVNDDKNLSDLNLNDIKFPLKYLQGDLAVCSACDAATEKYWLKPSIVNILGGWFPFIDNTYLMRKLIYLKNKINNKCR